MEYSDRQTRFDYYLLAVIYFFSYLSFFTYKGKESFLHRAVLKFTEDNGIELS